MTIIAPVTLDGQALNVDDVDGLDWKVQAVPGWFDGPSTFVDQVQRIVSHGQFGQPGHRGGRLIILKGRVSARNSVSQASDVSQARETITTLLADGGFGIFETHDPAEGVRWAEVQLLEEPVFADWNGAGDEYLAAFSYQMTLLAPDSHKYGDTSTDSTGFAVTPAGAGLVFPLFMPSGSLSWGVPVDPGILTVTNTGRADAAVVFTVDGPTPVDGFRIIDLLTGDQITYLGGAVPAGSSVVFDGRDASVVIDGVADRSGDTIVEAWPQVPPGESRSFLFEAVAGFTAANLTGACTATYW